MRARDGPLQSRHAAVGMSMWLARQAIVWVRRYPTATLVIVVLILAPLYLRYVARVLTGCVEFIAPVVR